MSTTDTNLATPASPATPTTCARVETWLALQTAGSVTTNEQTKLDAHLEDCASCAHLHSVLADANAGSDADVDVATAATAATADEDAAEPAESVIVISKRKAVWAMSAMAALAVAASIAVALRPAAHSPSAKNASASASAIADPSTHASSAFTSMAMATSSSPPPTATPTPTPQPTATSSAIPLASSSSPPPSQRPLPSSTPVTAAAAGGMFISIMEGNTPRHCTNATSEVIDPDSSHPRFIIMADCPDDKRFSMVTYPQKLPGKVTNIHGARFMDRRTGQEWKSTEASMNVTRFDGVGGVTEGDFEATMSPRLNRDAVKIVAKFRATRTSDRFAP